MVSIPQRGVAGDTTHRRDDTDRGRFSRPARGRFAQRRGKLHPATFGVSILALKLAAFFVVGLVLLFVAVLWVADLRTGAIDVVARSLIEQSDTVQAALMRSDNERTGAPLVDALQPAAETAENAERTELAGLLVRLTEGSTTRVRTYDAEGRQVTDNLDDAAERGPLHPPGGNLLSRLWDIGSSAILPPRLTAEPVATGAGAGGQPTEIAAALSGTKSVVKRATGEGDILVSVATPLRNGAGEVVGVLHLRSGPGIVSDLARRQELAIARVFLIAGGLAIALSIVLAAMVTRPLRRLAAEAEYVRSGGFASPMPTLYEKGEVGELSRVLNEMTEALYKRIDAIEAFAGEVAHELKNPLTSLRSAVETLPLARNEDNRTQLMDVIQHDIRRIDRLISDISDASKLDAELNRQRSERFNLVAVLSSVIDAQADLAAEHSQSVEMVAPGDADTYMVLGSDSRLRQVFDNLIDNARSFTPDGGRIIATAQRFAGFIEVVIDDEGPGIAEEALERIFERFYTDRPGPGAFGNNSGLGLAISRQIVEAQNGEIFAENRYRPTGKDGHEVAGARFTVRLPSAS
ncbi:MAG: sensor histidine kinase [Acuticoccus sp.]